MPVHVVRAAPFHERVLAQEAPGGPAAEACVVAPTLVAPGEPFRLRVAVTDVHGYPAAGFDGVVRIRGEFAQPGQVEAVFRPDGPPLCQLEGVAIGQAGRFRFVADLGGRQFASNPVVCTPEPGHRIFWGDPHVHTILSDCHADKARSLNFCYAAARHLTLLDWVAAADHVSNGRCEFSKWREQRVVCDAYDDPPHFATLHAYEASLKGGAGGDNNVYLRRPIDLFVDQYEEGNVKTLCETLAEQLDPADFFVVPHHTTRTGKHGEIGDAIYPGERAMPVVEIHSKWGTSEYRGNPNPLQKIHPGPSYAVDLLNRGLRLGFIAGTDSHGTMPAGRGIEPGHIDRLPGLTAALAPRLTRDAVFDAVRHRRAYATSLERIYLSVSVGGHAPGAACAWPPHTPRTVRVAAAARSDLTAVEIVRNGRVVARHPGSSWRADFEWTDADALAGERVLESSHLGTFAYYYVRITCSSGAQAWSTPVWLRTQ